MNTLTKNNSDVGSIFGSFDQDQINLIKNTVCKNSTDNELKLFLYTCKHSGLDPLLKQIYAIKRGSLMTIQTSIDGLRLIAERTGRYAPGSEPKYSYNSNGNLESATAYVNKMTPDGKWHEVAATAFFNEYAQAFNGKLTQFWGKMPHVMLSKCAEANALRKAFPFELAGLYSSEEMMNGLNKTNHEEEFLKEEDMEKIEEDLVEISIPERIDAAQVEEYIKKLSEDFEKPIPILKKMINQRPEKFWESFNKWKEETSKEIKHGGKEEEDMEKIEEDLVEISIPERIDAAQVAEEYIKKLEESIKKLSEDFEKPIPIWKEETSKEIKHGGKEDEME